VAHQEVTGRAADRLPRVRVDQRVTLLGIAHQLPGWGWPPFLTDRFGELLPAITVSLALTSAVNVLGRGGIRPGSGISPSWA
jgi:hypothetical protein